MPPKVKITKEMVAEASFEVIRENGHEELNARKIAEKLGCSTQPVLYSFKTVDEIREAAYEKADAYHTAFIMPKETDENPMLALGLNYVKFGFEEKNLFRFLFQTNKFGGKDISTLFNNPELTGVLGVMAQGLGVEMSTAKDMFLAFFCAAHGMASLLANNAMESNETQAKNMLADIFRGMIEVRREK